MRVRLLLMMTWLLASACIAVIAVFVMLNQARTHSSYLEEALEFEIPSGMRFKQVIQKLNEQGLLVRPEVMNLYGRFKGMDRQLKAGVYQLQGELTAEGILNQLIQGKVATYQVTLIEGLTFQQWLQQLNEHPQITKTLPSGDKTAVKGWFHQMTKPHGLPNDNPEGWFYPDTYQFNAKAKDTDILERAFLVMLETLETEWQGRQVGLPYKVPYEALIMGSIIEKETGVAHERPRIASVFVNRLNKKMRLQTDPTVIYGIGDAFDGNITRKHLREPTPYNTYVIKGLPPTPISMMSHAALKAALHPDGDTALYFVSKGDGTHQFSETLQAHNKAVREYQLNKR